MPVPRTTLSDNWPDAGQPWAAGCASRRRRAGDSRPDALVVRLLALRLARGAKAGGRGRNGRRNLCGDQRGQTTITEFLVLVLFMCMLVGFAALVALAQPAKVAVHAAARNCARMAVESLSAGRGLSQASQTAILSLHNQNLESRNAEVRLSADRWQRGGAVTCRVVYHVPVGDLPMVSWFWRQASLPVEAAVTLSIEPYKSRWPE